jgi:hypothetical protein
MPYARSYIHLLLAPVAAFALAGQAFAGQAAVAGAPRGTAGLAPLAITAVNRSDTPIACAATVAHWFSVDLATVAAGATATIALWRDPADGAVFALNEHADRLPVERLWCGFAGRAWATRSEIALPKHAGDAADVALACARDGERLDCR